MTARGRSRRPSGRSRGATIHLSAWDDSSSLLSITARQSELLPGTALAGTASIRVTRVAHDGPAAELPVPALLKLDVQGFELPAWLRVEPHACMRRHSSSWQGRQV